jgi:hypothetical protein
MINKMEKIANALTPPRDGEDPTHWRWKVWLAIMSMMAIGFFHVVAEKGLIPGIDGAAHAGEIKGIERRMTALEAKQNVALRLQLAAEICRVYRQRVDEESLFTRGILDNAFDRLQEEYASVNAGNRYSVGECSNRKY